MLRTFTCFARLLFDGLVARCPSAPIFLDVPRPNAVARMYAVGDPGIPVSQVYGVTSFELG